MASEDPNPTLLRIERKTLVSVCFVLDYVQFQLEDLVLAALALPILFDADGTHTAENPGYKDRLCRQIGAHVRSTTENREYLEFSFDNGNRIVIRLDSATPPGPEMAMLSGKGAFIASWLRPF